jgi:orotate phosphoribosyltransferase
MHQAQKIAELLLNLKAVTLNIAQPFHYTSGIVSPIY